jgi:hypothetical protein
VRGGKPRARRVKAMGCKKCTVVLRVTLLQEIPNWLDTEGENLYIK